MYLLTQCEIMRMSRAELRVWMDQISRTLLDLPEGSGEREITLTNLQEIRRELARRDRLCSMSR